MLGLCEAMILDGDSLVLRGYKNPVQQDYDALILGRVSMGQPVNSLTLVFMEYLGLTEGEIKVLVDAIVTMDSMKNMPGFINQFRCEVLRNNLRGIRDCYNFAYQYMCNIPRN